jgi:hypothetical protein
MTSVLILAGIAVAAIAAIAILRPGSLASLAILALGVVAAFSMLPTMAPDLVAFAKGTGRVADTARYRLDVTLLVDGRPITGSVVQEVLVRNAGGTGNPLPRVRFRLNGQALAIPLPGRPMLIALMMTGTEDAYRHLLPDACGLEIGDGSVDSYVERVHSFSGSCELTGRNIPRLLSIENPNDAHTLALVDRDNLAAGLGSGVEFHSARITTTDEAVTAGLETVLPWLIAPVDKRGRDYVLNKIDIGIRLNSTAFISRFPR